MTAETAAPTHAVSRRLLWGAGLLFVLSGASSLAYEVVWVKILTLQFGSSAWSISTVVASFMAGLGAGSAWAGRRADRIRHPLRVYALLELGIAVFGMASVVILQNMGGVLGVLYEPLQGASGLFVLAQLLLTFAVLFIPTVLMGASLPVLVVGLSGEQGFGQRVATLYGINTLGAALGALGTGLFLLPMLGISGTVAVAVGVGLLVALGAWLLSAGLTSPEAMVEPAATSDEVRPPRLLVLAAFSAGVLGIFYQVAWTRLLIPVFGSSTYAFTIILTTFLVGIGLGGLAAALPALHRRSYASVVGGSMALTSLAVLLGLFLVNALPEIFSALAMRIGDRTGLLFLAQGMVAGSIILLPTVAMGAVLPLAIAGWRARTRSAGRAVGGIYAANTFGSILGSVLAGFVVLPVLGAAGSIRLAAGVGLALAAVLLLSDRGTAGWGGRLVLSRRFVLLGGVLLLASPAVDVMNLQRGVFRLSHQKFSGGDLLDVREGRGATVTVERSQESTVLRVNGKADASSFVDLKIQFLLGHLPMLLHEAPRRACLIGYGSGATAHAVATHPGLETLDVVELEPAVVEVSSYFRSVNGDVLDDPRVHLALEDGRSFLRYNERAYDVIISEPSNPWIAGIGALFTSEHYRTARARLAPGGLYCQWIQSYEISDETLEGMLSTLAGEFPHVVVFFVNTDLVCVASELPLVGDPGRCATRMAVPAVARSLDRVGVDDPMDLFCAMLRVFPGDGDLFDSEIRNTDDNLWLEYRAPVEMYRNSSVFLEWSSPARYLENLGRLFPGHDRSQLARDAADSLWKLAPQQISPGLPDFLRALAGELADGDARADVLRASERAAWRRQEMLAKPDRVLAIRGFLKQEDYASCIPVCESMLAVDPRSGLAHRVLGVAYLDRGETERALTHLELALQTQPDDYEAHALMAEGLTRLGRDDGGHFALAMELNPKAFYTWNVLLTRLIQETRFEEARDRLRDAAKLLQPKDARVLFQTFVPLLTKAGY